MASYSREIIRYALEWDGSSSINDDGSDWPYEVLEQADPKEIAVVCEELNATNWGLALPSDKTSPTLTTVETQVKKPVDTIDPNDRWSWTNEF